MALSGAFVLDSAAHNHTLTEPIVPLPMFSFTGNKKSVAGGGMTNFYGKSGLNFYTQTKTVTSLWREEDALAHDKAQTVMPTQS